MGSGSLLPGVCVSSLGEPAVMLQRPGCVWLCGSFEARLDIMRSGSQHGDMDHPEGVQFSPKNLSRSQDGVKESFSNVCYSVRCCC